MDDLEKLARAVGDAPEGTETGQVWDGEIKWISNTSNIHPSVYRMEDILAKRDELMAAGELEEREMEVDKGYCEGWMTNNACPDCSCGKEIVTWDGDIPPCRTNCEVGTDTGGQMLWRKCYFIEAYGGRYWMKIEGEEKDNLYKQSFYQFRPIKTDRERMIEKIVEVIEKFPVQCVQEKAEALLDHFTITDKEG